MATYTVTGRNTQGAHLVSVQITAIDQDDQIVQEIQVVNAIRSLLAGTSGVSSVLAQKYEQVTTVV